MDIEPDLSEPRLIYPEDDSVAALRARFGEHIVFSFAGAFTLVHTDAPGDEVIARRTEEFDEGEFFFSDNCPLCQLQKQKGGYVVFARTAATVENGR